eukprot:8766944-Pyramimonas_sp.AAC.1
MAQKGRLNASTPLFSPTPSTTAPRGPPGLPSGLQMSPKRAPRGPQESRKSAPRLKSSKRTPRPRSL